MPHIGLKSPGSKEELSSHYRLPLSGLCVSSLKVSLIDAKMRQLKYDQRYAATNHLRL